MKLLYHSGKYNACDIQTDGNNEVSLHRKNKCLFISIYNRDNDIDKIILSYNSKKSKVELQDYGDTHEVGRISTHTNANIQRSNRKKRLE